MSLIQGANDAHPDARDVGIVGVAALGGCYHGKPGEEGVVFERYVRAQPTVALTQSNAHKIIINALKSSKIRFSLAETENEMESVASDLLNLAKDFHVIKSALLQIFLREDSFLDNVCYADNGGTDIRPMDRKSIKDGNYLESGIKPNDSGMQLNVYLPTDLVTNREKCNIQLYTKCGEQNAPISQDYLTEFRNKVVNTIYTYSQ